MAASFPRRSILLIALIAMGIAAFLPFDQGLRLLSFGRDTLHILLMGLLALVGGFFAQKGGLTSAAHLRVGLAWALGMAAYVLVLDGVLMRPMVPPGALAFVHTPLPGRLAVYMARAFNESVIYRLFLFGGLIALLRSSRPLSPAMVLALALLAQMVNIALNVALIEPGPVSGAMLLYWSLRYVLPGVVWGWLYWRHGFVTTEIASTGVHVFLQPAVGWVLG
ncbi:hypothetical protein [Novosphingobium rosa]|uniref:hypothetical protein n=1 Tax=Novosphingobium rosa TaxID=76978 RepID=UPI0008371EBB|nr:hypothetical protein [Novosphingobium rosa]